IALLPFQAERDGGLKLPGTRRGGDLGSFGSRIGRDVLTRPVEDRAATHQTGRDEDDRNHPGSHDSLLRKPIVVWGTVRSYIALLHSVQLLLEPGVIPEPGHQPLND